MDFHVDAADPDPVGVERLLRSLPEWFGIESSIIDYVEDARRLATVLAWPAGPRDDTIGALLLRRHFPTAAEIHLMAVRRDWHRRGVGTALIAAAERMVRADGVDLLSVKTLGPSHPDPNYRRTRAFYRAVGFQPVQELLGLWPDNPCLIMVKLMKGAHDPGTGADQSGRVSMNLIGSRAGGCRRSSGGAA